jgi:diguanylate cyclase (GGDEF)-like protein/PAS domain S-box-containing protein
MLETHGGELRHKMDSGSTDNTPGILIIEDEAIVAREIRARLTRMGHRVVGVAHAPDKAIELAKSTRPDLLLTDINLGEVVDGIDVAREIIAEREIPVIFLTAYSDEETVKRAKLVAPYNYILKPLEYRELQIAIELAVYKFKVERELRETKQLLTTALQCIGNVLIFIDPDGKVTQINDDAEDLFGWTKHDAIGIKWDKFLMPENEPGLGSAREFISKAIQTDAVTRLSPFLALKRSGVQALVDGIAGPIETHGVMSGAVLILRELAELLDPVESIPEPKELAGQGLADGGYSFVLLLISPDNIEEVNEKLGREAGDRVINEITTQLNKSLRSTDLASLYAGAIFSANLPDTSLEKGHKIAETILRNLTDKTFLNGKVALTFSIGLAHCDPHDVQNSPLELFRRANWALNVAKESGGEKVVIWRPNVEIEMVGNLDRQSGRFSANVGSDYRNMLLLWNTMTIVGKAVDTDDWRDRLLEHFRRSFELEKVALIIQEDHQLKLQSSFVADEAEPWVSIGTNVQPGHVEILKEMFLSRSEPEIRSIKEGDARAYFVPINRDDLTSVLYLATASDNEIREKDLSFIKTLADYFAVSMYNLRTSAGIGESDTASADEGQLLYKSLQMESLMEHVRLVAPTDATVLITGESGTGKELLASTIHQQSQRRDYPLVIVDCGAIVESLIESELFGYVKGAFTGAQSSSPGRLKEAHGGTIFLDEIGELPVDTQVKLLRFVQHRQLVAVGGTQYETVDTRVIAATNKNLKLLVEQGKFREDLYYRLNVFAIHCPPLRDRAEDVLLLARRFLKRYAKQYNKQITGFTPDAEIALQEYSWPGNIRELINMMIRSIILCQDDQISTIHLELFPGGSDPVPVAAPPEVVQVETEPKLVEQPLNSIEKNLSLEIAELVRACIDADELMPIGRWLEEDLILASLTSHNDVAYRAADALSIPETTIRRKITKIKRNRGTDRPDRSESWNRVQSLLRQIIPIARTRGVPAIDLANQLLIAQIRMITRSVRQGATLAGVSIPTYRRMLKELS